MRYITDGVRMSYHNNVGIAEWQKGGIMNISGLYTELFYAIIPTLFPYMFCRSALPGHYTFVFTVVSRKYAHGR